ncbi:hypothetical protein N0V83_002924 [Neocucurbitaria cava]|uniref:Uncharacterized protein n=1 Tax=Neocucurbitaria cava TaxID=798079 RepID=A0A9W8YEL2_9PLEO|nr:hypothetical protein N0V83_002924 [Neocucurbitaria cava]
MARNRPDLAQQVSDKAQSSSHEDEAEVLPNHVSITDNRPKDRESEDEKTHRSAADSPGESSTPPSPLHSSGSSAKKKLSPGNLETPSASLPKISQEERPQERKSKSSSVEGRDGLATTGSKQLKYACTICGQTFGRESHHRDHEMSHRGGYKCPECGKAFTRVNDLKRHRKLHDRKSNSSENEPLFEGNITSMRSTRATYADQIYGAAQTAPTIPRLSPVSDTSRRKDGGLKDETNDKTITSNDKNDIRLRVDAGAPLSLSFTGDMEGRTLQLFPADDGMADLVIGPRQDNDDVYRREGGHALVSRKSRVVLSQEKRAAEGSLERDRPSGHSTRDKPGYGINRGKSSPTLQAYFQSTSDEYDSNESDSDEVQGNPRLSMNPRTSAKVIRPRTRQLNSAGARSDNTTPPKPIYTKVTTKRSASQSRPIIMQQGNSNVYVDDCADPYCTKCGGNGFGRQPRSSTQTDQYYHSPPSPPNLRSRTSYMQGSATVQPAQIRIRHSSTSRPAPMSYAGAPVDNKRVPATSYLHGSSATQIGQSQPRRSINPYTRHTSYHAPRPAPYWDPAMPAPYSSPPIPYSSPLDSPSITYGPPKPTARVVVNNTKANRRQSTQMYDKMYEQYAQAKAIEERLNEERLAIAKANEEAAARAKFLEQAEPRAFEEQYKADNFQYYPSLQYDPAPPKQSYPPPSLKPAQSVKSAPAPSVQRRPTRYPQAQESGLESNSLALAVLGCTEKHCNATFKGQYRHGAHARHMVRKHQRPNCVSSSDKEDGPSYDSLVGQPGMPLPAPRPRGSNLGFSPKDDQLLIELREVKSLGWKQITDFFPGRARRTLKARYYTNFDIEGGGPPPDPATVFETQQIDIVADPITATTTANTEPEWERTRLTVNHRNTLEKYFQAQPQPSKKMKKDFADDLGISLVRVDNWFRNRRAKAKQDAKKLTFNNTRKDELQHQSDDLPEPIQTVSGIVSADADERKAPPLMIDWGVINQTADREEATSETLHNEAEDVSEILTQGTSTTLLSTPSKGDSVDFSQATELGADSLQDPTTTPEPEIGDYGLDWGVNGRVTKFCKVRPALASAKSTPQEELVHNEVPKISPGHVLMADGSVAGFHEIIPSGIQPTDKGWPSCAVCHHQLTSEEGAVYVQGPLPITDYIRCKSCRAQFPIGNRIEVELGGGTRSSSWSAKDDEILIQARAQGLNWNQIGPKHFPSKTPNACRKRYERLMERQYEKQWDGVKLDVLPQAYMEARREFPEEFADPITETVIQEDDDNMSVISSYAASVDSIFSISSVASSASVLSRASGYSATQIATATKVLISIFHEDRVLLPLYRSALDNAGIGPERLQRNLRRLFKAYAEHLGREASERLEYLASRLVLAKSGALAQSIVDKFKRSSASPQLSSSNQHEDSSADDDTDEETDRRPVNEDAFEDLVAFREFLVKSEAFQIFHAQVQAFVLPKSVDLTVLEGVGDLDPKKEQATKCDLQKMVSQNKLSVRTLQGWLVDVKHTVDAILDGPDIGFIMTTALFLAIDALMLSTDGLLIATGQLEPSLKQGMVRLRWQCVRTSTPLQTCPTPKLDLYLY